MCFVVYHSALAVGLRFHVNRVLDLVSNGRMQIPYPVTKLWSAFQVQNTNHSSHRDSVGAVGVLEKLCVVEKIKQNTF